MKYKNVFFAAATTIAFFFGFASAFAGSEDCAGGLKTAFKTDVAHIADAYRLQLKGKTTSKQTGNMIRIAKNSFTTVALGSFGVVDREGGDTGACFETLRELENDYSDAVALGLYAEEIRTHALDMIRGAVDAIESTK